MSYFATEHLEELDKVDIKRYLDVATFDTSLGQIEDKLAKHPRPPEYSTFVSNKLWVLEIRGFPQLARSILGDDVESSTLLGQCFLVLKVTTHPALATVPVLSIDL